MDAHNYISQRHHHSVPPQSQVKKAKAPGAPAVTVEITANKATSVFKSALSENTFFNHQLHVDETKIDAFAEFKVNDYPALKEELSQKKTEIVDWYKENRPDDLQGEGAQADIEASIERDFVLSVKSGLLTSRLNEFSNKFLDRHEKGGEVQPYHIAGSYIGDLEEYKTKRGHTTKEQKKAIDSVITTLTETQTITKDLMQIQFEKTDVHNQTQNVARGIGNRLKEMEPGEQLVIQGGTASHAVLYEFVKGKNDTFTMNVINTGDEAPSIIWDAGKKAMKTENLCIENIPGDKINDQFLKDLLLFTTSSKGEKSIFKKNPMKQIYKLLDSTLVAHGGGKYGTPRESYLMQRSGTCVARCLSQYVAQRLGPEIHADFEITSLDRHVGKLAKLKRTEEFHGLKTLNRLHRVGRRELDRMIGARYNVASHPDKQIYLRHHFKWFNNPRAKFGHHRLS